MNISHRTNSASSSGLPHASGVAAQASCTGDDWQPGFLKLRAFAGICGLAIAICCLLGSLTILVVSDGQPVNSWHIQPTVYLAIVTAISNAALVHARKQAIPVSWWYHAFRGGTIRSLQRHYEVGQSIVHTLMHSQHMSLLHFACLATSLVIIDGPLLQRASSVVPATISKTITLNLTLTPELPIGFAGYLYEHLFWPSDSSNSVSVGWMNNTAMLLNEAPCTGTCRATIKGPGLSQRNCTSQTWPITSAMAHDYNATWGPWKAYASDIDGSIALLPAFTVSMNPGTYGLAAERELMSLTTGLLSLTHLQGEYKQTICNFAPAILEYDVEIQGSTISLVGDASQAKFVRFANNTKPIRLSDSSKKQPSVLQELTYLIAMFVDANATVALGDDAGPAAFFSLYGPSFNAEARRHMVVSDKMVLGFVDPTPGAIAKYNQIMFRGAVAVSSWPNITTRIDPDVSIKQTVVAQQMMNENVFKTNLRWYAGAAVLEFVTALLVLPMFWGWWTLGKNLTLSPFDIALAFNSPLLNDVNSAAGATGVVQKLGDLKLRYGAVDPDEPVIYTPMPDQAGTIANGRLGVARSDSVIRPRTRVRFRS